MRARTMRRIAWIRAYFSRRCWGRGRGNENGPHTARLGDRVRGGSGGFGSDLCSVRAACGGGARGGSFWGLVFGVIGFAFMIFAAALGERKRVPTWRLVRAQAWMRGHLWLGLLTLPMILFHGGFHFGGAMTRALMWLLIVTVGSGMLGAALQHYLPRRMTADVPLETIYD